MEEYNCPYPRCTQCDMFVPQKELNGRHLATELCMRGMDSKWCRLAEEKAWEGAERAITAYGSPLSQITSFKYLGRVLVAEDNDWPSVVHNLWRTKKKWERLTRVFIR